MPEDSKRDIKDIYDEGIAEVFKIVGSIDATSKQKKVAMKTAQDLSSLLIAHTLDTIAGRTAILSGLIVELNQVIDSIETKSPYEDALKNFTSIVTRTQKLFTDEKANLV